MRHESQQIQARLRPFVQVKPMIGDVFAYDGLGDVEAREVAGRVQTTVFDDIDHLRRKISRRRFVVTLPIDRMDALGVLIQPQSEYAQACIKAMERVFDRVGVEALFADVATGRDFETTVTFASDGGKTVDCTSTGITYAKLLEIHENWIDTDVGTEIQEHMVLSVTGEEHTDLMNETELTSGDYSRQYVVDRGTVQMATGIQVIKFAADAREPILPVSAGSVRSCFAITTRALCYGLSQDMEISIKDRPDLVNVNQVQITGILGAVRTEGVHAQKVTTTAT
ncbi:MAG: hypothetical protein GY928_34490 [Colwellia sp.]|nr:hypothetical protein [Colwellia sp.]